MLFYTDDQLEQLDIFELRHVGRQIGVASPTTKKRNDLIQAIKDIQEGKVEPTKNKLRGRPSTSKRVDKEKVRKIGMDLTSNNPWNTSEELTFKSRFYGYNQNNDDDFVVVQGYVSKMKNGYALLDFSNPTSSDILCLISPNTIIKYGLQVGDQCKIQARFLYESELPLAEEVLEIQSVPNNQVRKTFDQLPAIFNGDELITSETIQNDNKLSNLFTSPIKKGDKILASLDENNILENFLTPISNNLFKDSELVVILIGTTPEIVYQYKQTLNCTLFFSLYSDPIKKQEYLYELGISYCKIKATYDKNVFCFVDNLQELELDNEQDNKDNEPIKFKELMSYARNFENSSLTITCNLTKEKLDSIKQIRKFFNHEISVK